MHMLRVDTCIFAVLHLSGANIVNRARILDDCAQCVFHSRLSNRRIAKLKWASRRYGESALCDKCGQDEIAADKLTAMALRFAGR